MSAVDQNIAQSFLGTEDNLWPPNYSSKQLEASAVVKTGSGILYGFTVSNTKASAQFVQVFDARSLPADGAVPIISQTVAAGSVVGFNWIPGRTFFAGIVLCNSSTQGSKTLGSADCLFDAQYL